MLVIQLSISLIRVRGGVSALHGDYLAISYINLSCGVFNCIYTCSTAVPLPRFPLPLFPLPSGITCECMRLFIFMSFASARLGIGLVRHYDSIKCDALALGFFNCFSITCQRMLPPCPCTFPLRCHCLARADKPQDNQRGLAWGVTC